MPLPLQHPTRAYVGLGTDKCLLALSECQSSIEIDLKSVERFWSAGRTAGMDVRICKEHTHVTVVLFPLC